MTERTLQIVVMGVAGSGKTAVATLLADHFGRELVDGDSLHPAENVAKMAAGTALTDADRWPSLEAIRAVLSGPGQVVVACSALRRSHRDVLRQADDVRFLHLDVDPATAVDRLASRLGHFMGPEMSEGQFRALEPPAPDEADVIVIDARRPLDAVVDQAVTMLSGIVP